MTEQSFEEKRAREEGWIADRERINHAQSQAISSMRELEIVERTVKNAFPTDTLVQKSMQKAMDLAQEVIGCLDDAMWPPEINISATAGGENE